MKKQLLLLSVLLTMALSSRAAAPAIYYLAGTMNEWSAQPGYALAANEEAAPVEEYMITLDLKTTDQFKIIKFEDETIKTWYPDPGSNYGQNGEITKDGKYTVYFRPNADGGSDWFSKVIYVAEETGSDIDAVIGSEPHNVKIMENGNVSILKNGVRYNLNGAVVK